LRLSNGSTDQYRLKLRARKAAMPINAAWLFSAQVSAALVGGLMLPSWNGGQGRVEQHGFYPARILPLLAPKGGILPETRSD
jgi:hypothetical protein